jgi:choline dehydrogenase-like flavoprotein
MTYIRPSSSQIDLLSQLGNTGWDWNTLFNASKASESFQPPSSALTALGAAYNASDHGFTGPLAVSFNPHLTYSPANTHEILNETWAALGLDWNEDVNGGDLRGFTVWPQTLDGRADVREDAARAYYYPVEGRSNLAVFLNTTVTKVLWSDGMSSGEANGCEDCNGMLKTAFGVEVLNQDGTAAILLADNEIILSAGSLRTPALLELSGVGNPRIVSNYSIPTVIDLPSVGENLQDQTNVLIAGTSGVTFEGYPTYVTFASIHDLLGSNASAAYETACTQLPRYAAQIASQNNGAVNASVIQYLLETQLSLLFHSNTPAAEILSIAEATGAGGSLVGTAFWGLMPFARGNVHIASGNATSAPSINPNFFMTDWDDVVQVAAARLARKSLMMGPWGNFVGLNETAPSLAIVPVDADDGTWITWMKETCMCSSYLLFPRLRRNRWIRLTSNDITQTNRTTIPLEPARCCLGNSAG